MISPSQRLLPDKTQHSQQTDIHRTPIDEWSAYRRDIFLTKHNTHNRQTSMLPVGFEPAIPASEQPQTHALNRAATGIGQNYVPFPNFEAQTARLSNTINNPQRASPWVYKRRWASFVSAIVASLLFHMKSVPCLITFWIETSVLFQFSNKRSSNLLFWRIALREAVIFQNSPQRAGNGRRFWHHEAETKVFG